MDKLKIAKGAVLLINVGLLLVQTWITGKENEANMKKFVEQYQNNK